MGVFTFAFERNLFSNEVLYFVLPLNFVIRAIGSSEKTKELLMNNTKISNNIFT